MNTNMNIIDIINDKLAALAAENAEFRGFRIEAIDETPDAITARFEGPFEEGPGLEMLDGVGEALVAAKIARSFTRDEDDLSHGWIVWSLA